MSVELRWATAEAITSDLEQARETIEQCGRRAPRSVDAGELTPLVTEMLALVASAAAELSAGLLGATDNVRCAVRGLQSADSATQEAFTSGQRW
ncbi:hypothetical protein JOE61_001297 [Nocardioides salarius]|uniref:Uncharacterized protein n=1 Tax=Nocardioides salarius TaxID=374513 RepID=A0ABS2M8H5_9ACTN|nr:hypothetical protein [Nocardioides salarius]MBM7507483.1 hypothetical protein [Nocardioides salarius]